MPTPSVGRDVHYVARGSADGVFPSACRAAKITAVDGHEDDLTLFVMTPNGTFHDAGIPLSGSCAAPRPGTWHWPERVGE